MTKPQPSEKVYRVETDEGDGVYHVWAHDYNEFPCDLYDKHPDIYTDKGFKKKQITGFNDISLCISVSCDANFRFGFESIEQLKQWFYHKESLQSIARQCNVSVYEVKSHKICKGDKQLVFVLDKTTKKIETLYIMKDDKLNAPFSE
jgi:hypothetical protein